MASIRACVNVAGIENIFKNISCILCTAFTNRNNGTSATVHAGKCCFFSGRKTGLVNDLQQTTIGMKSEEEVQMFHKNIKYKESLTVFWPRVILQTSSRDRIVFQWFPFHIPEYCSTDYNIITTMQTISSWTNLWIITTSKQYSK